MRKTLTALIMAGASLLGCGKSDPLPAQVRTAAVSRPVSNKPESEEEAQLRKLIEKEIRKHDMWAADVVRQDYTRAEGPGWVSLLREKTLESTLLLGHYAAYDPEKDHVLLPLDGSEGDLIEAMDHELWHVLYDSKGVKGIFFGKDFKGPSEAEIVAHCNSKMSQAEYVQIRKELEYSLRYQAVERQITALAENYGGMLKDVFAALTEISKDFGQMTKNLCPYFAKDDNERLKEAIMPIEKSYAALREAYLHAGKVLDQRNANTDSQKLTKESIEQLEKDIRQCIDSLKPYSNLFEEMQKARETFYAIIYAAEDKKHQAKVEELTQLIEKSEGNKRNRFESDLETEKKVYQINSHIRDSRKLSSFRLSVGRIDELLGTLAGNINERSVMAIFTPDEVMARITDSVYSLHFDRLNQHKFTPSEADLALLERCTYKGKPLFSKGTEKYRLGLQMIKDGSSAEEVREKLEYATSFSYKGKDYSWPETDFCIKGAIPHQTKD